MLQVLDERVMRPAEVNDGMPTLAAADGQQHEQHDNHKYQAAE